ncbi:MAG: PKD domain-containing protein [Chitinophagales bacterium]
MNKLSLTLFVICTLLFGNYANAQFSIAAGGTDYTQNFDGLGTSASSWTNNSTLTGWYAATDATASITTVGVNTGTTTTAGFYSFGVLGTNALADRALGYVTSNAYTGAASTGKNYLGWRLKNNTGSVITSLTITWTGEQWRREANTSTQDLVLTYLTGASITSVTGTGYTATTSKFTSPQTGSTALALDGNATANKSAGISYTISSLNLANGQEIMLRWEDLNDANSDHILVLDDVTINATISSTPTSNVGVAGTASPATISSLVNTSGAAASAFNFYIKDDSTSDDALNTLITDVVINQGTGNTISDWTQAIAGAILSDGTSSISGTVNATNITFSSIPTATSSDLGYVADNGNKAYTLKIYLKSALGGTLPATIDGLAFGFKVTASSITASASGTPFSTGTGAIESGTGKNVVTVVATALNYTTAFSPTTIDPNTNFTTAGVVRAQDANGNTDKDFASAVTITNSGSLGMVNASGSFAAGVFTFPSNFQFTNGGATVTVTVDDGNTGTTNATSGNIIVNNPPVSDVTSAAGGEAVSVSSIANTSGAAVSVFNFTVTDDVSGNDALATLISNLVISQGTGNDVANWTNVIAGATLSDGTNNLAGTVNATNITFASIPTGAGQLGEVADGTSKTYTLSLWINVVIGGGLANTVDGMNLAFKVDRSSFTASVSGTPFAPGAGTAVESGATNNAVDVTATALNFTTAFAPTINNYYSTFSTAGIVRAQDANGNTDLSVNSSVTVSNSAGYTMINTPTAFSAGVLNFPGGFQFTTGGGTTTVTVNDGNPATTNATSAVLTINVPTPTLSTSVPKNFYCPGSTAIVSYTASNFLSGNVFTAQLSDASGSFASPINIGSVTSTVSGTISATIPGNTANGAGYRIRVIGSAPAFNGTDNGSNIAVQYNTQTVIFNESMGVNGTSGTGISTYETNNDFDNDALTMSGSGDLRNTSASTGYTGASGGSNVFLTYNGNDFTIDGINTLGYAPIKLTFGLFKSINGETGSNLILEFSTNGGSSWTTLPWVRADNGASTLPTTSGSAGWYQLQSIGYLPQAANLRLHFANANNSNISSSIQFRIDDVVMSYGTATTPSVTPGGPVSQCAGTVNLTANPAGGTYAWSTSAITQSITVGTTGNYTVTITDGFGCTASRGPVSVTINTPVTPSINITSANNPVCAGVAQTFNVGTTVNGGTPSYQWKVNGSNVGTGTSYSTSSLNVNDVVTCEMTTSLSCVTTTTVSSNAFVARGALTGTTTQVFTENFGSATVADINNYNSASNSTLSFAGLGEIKITTPSAGYTGASGNGNAFMTSFNSGTAGTKTIEIGGINTTNAFPNKLTFGLNKNTNADNGNDLLVEYSLDGLSYYSVGLVTVPTGSNTGGTNWSQVVLDNALPYGTNVRLRFSNVTSGTVQYRIDDVTLIKYNPVNATISAGGPTAFCPGGSVTLTAAPSGMSGYSWSNGGSSISTTVSSSNTYKVSVSDGTCASLASQVVTVNAVPTTTPSASASPICSGSATTLNANATAGSGTISGYTWSAGLGNVASGSVSPAGTTTYTVTVTNSNSCTASGSVMVTVNTCGVNTWLGNNTNWHDDANWSNGHWPNSCAEDVLVPATAIQPTVSTSTAVHDIEVQGGAIITVVTGGGVQVCGTVKGSSTATAAQFTGAGRVTLVGSGLQQLQNKLSFSTLRLTNTAGATLASGAQVDVFTAVELETGTLNTTAGILRFRSTGSSSYAVLDNFSSGFSGSLTGNVTAERYYDAAGAAKNQHLMGSPITATPLSAFGASGTPGYIIPTSNCDELNSANNTPWGTVFSYDESHGATCAQAGWKVETAGTASATNGFSVYKTTSGVITVSGAPNLAGSYQATNLSNTGGWQNYTLQGRSVDAGWHIVANPYLSDLDISGNQAGFDPVKMVWNTTGPYAGSYQPATVVAPFQAFMVRKSTNGNANYTINASQRTRSGSPSFQKQANDHELTITAKNNSSNLLDATTIAFNADASANFDEGFDAVKSGGALTRHTLYTTMAGNQSWLCQNVVKDIETTNSIPLNMEPGVNGSYTFSFDGVNSFDPTSYIMLEDKQLNVWHDVRSGAYTFNANATDNWNRFVLHFTPAAKFATTDATCQAQGQLNITQAGSANWNYTIANSNNVTMATGTLNSNNAVISSLPAGVYTVTLVDNNNYTVVKNIQVNGVTPVNASMQASSQVAETGEDVTFTSTTVNAATTNWNFGDGSSAQSSVATHQYATEGVYTVSLTVTNTAGCSSTTSQTVTVTAKTATGIDAVENNGLRMWSNADRVFVDFSNLKQVEATIDIYNILGQKLSSEKFGKSSIYSRTLSNLDAGYVLMSVKNNGEVITRKLFISAAK